VLLDAQHADRLAVDLDHVTRVLEALRRTSVAGRLSDQRSLI
jgi:hypothetical protein